MRVLTLMLAHDLDGHIDQVLELAEAYDVNEDEFRFRCTRYSAKLSFHELVPHQLPCFKHESETRVMPK